MTRIHHRRHTIPAERTERQEKPMRCGDGEFEKEPAKPDLRKPLHVKPDMRKPLEVKPLPLMLTPEERSRLDGIGGILTPCDGFDAQKPTPSMVDLLGGGLQNLVGRNVKDWFAARHREHCPPSNDIVRLDPREWEHSAPLGEVKPGPNDIIGYIDDRLAGPADGIIAFADSAARPAEPVAAPKERVLGFAAKLMDGFEP